MVKNLFAILLIASFTLGVESTVFAGHSTDQYNCPHFEDHEIDQYFKNHPSDPEGLDHDSNGTACGYTYEGQEDDSTTTQPKPDQIQTDYANLPQSFQATVVKVVDGDTADISYNGKEIRTRFNLVDTPEVYGGTEPYGPEASTFTKSILTEGSTVKVELDKERAGNFGHLLVYIYADGQMVNEELVKRGLAEVSVYNNTNYLNELNAAQTSAKDAGYGIWGGKPYVEPTEEDIEGHWAEDSIRYMMQEDLMQGYPDGTFKPQRSITRAEAVLVIVNGLEMSQDSSYTGNFNDVGATTWYSGAVGAAEQAGLITGYNSTTFKPNDPLSREEIASVLVAVGGYRTVESPTFIDVGKNRWSYSDISTLRANGIIGGYPDGSFKPKQDITRSEFTVMMKGVLQHLP